MKFSTHFIFAAVFILFLSCNQDKKSSIENQVPEQEWKQLLDKDLSQWQPFLGVPHKSTGIEGYEDVEDIRSGTPLGLSNRNNVFSVIEENDEIILKVTGEIFGSLMSKNEYENFG